MGSNTESREEGTGCTAKVAKARKDAERRAGHEATRIGTNAAEEAKRMEPQMNADERG